MGTPPPKDAPPPSEQDIVQADATFGPSPTGATICGFGLPTFGFSLSLPSFDLGIDFPNLNFGIALNCSLSDPLDAEFGFGGGRVPNYDPDQDDEYQTTNSPNSV